MTITLVMGASGLLGKAILDSKNISRATDSKIFGVTRNVNHALSNQIVSDYSLESAKKIAEEYGDKISLIIHCAGFPSVFRSLIDPVYDHVNNFDPILFSLEIARLTKAKLFYISTVEMYGCNNCEGRKEESPKNPQNPYGLNKMFAEEYIRMYNKISGVEFNILRPGVFIGDDIKKNIIFEIISSYQKGTDAVPIYVDLNSRFNFVHVNEIVNAIEFLLEKNILNETFNVGIEGSISVQELFDYFKKKYNFSPKINQLDNEYQYKTVPIQKLKSFGWKPTYDIYYYLDKLVENKL